MDDALRYVAAKGAESEADYAYTARQGNCVYDQSKVKVRTSGLVNITPNSYDALLQAASVSVITLALDAYGIMSYTGGVFNGQCSNEMNHAVNVVGYGTDAQSKQPFWLMRNSWGSSWGENGYFRLIRDQNPGTGICGMRQRPYYPTFAKAEAF
jgi:C1A family cysteine protease